ncbi:MAG: hypothetical protein IMF05_10190 [Proteobacteria bacterium]|nr:hypothetical protein [Pseudomonadota bacterium]
MAAEEGAVVGDIVRAISERFNVQAEPLVRSVSEVIAEHGGWAAGPALDQQMSSQKIVDMLGWKPLKTDVVSELS